MKDLKFRGVIEGVAIDVTFRTDMISNSHENFTIMQIQTGDSFSANDSKDSQLAKLGYAFKQLPSNLTAFKAFAVEKNLDLYIRNGNGDGTKLTLVDGSLSISESV